MSDSNRYTDLIAGYHREKPKYQQWLFTLTEPMRIACERLAVLADDFDIDRAVGPQLDAIGVRVGVSRNLPMTLTDVYFALDDVDGIGLDLGVWKGQFDPIDGTTVLDDDIYRAVIKAKVYQNHWDGTRGTLPKFLENVLGLFGQPAKILDLEDLDTMHVVIHLTKETTPPIVWELFSRRIIDITAAGVSMDLVENSPWFGLDYNTASIKGLDESKWFPLEEVLG